MTIKGSGAPTGASLSGPSFPYPPCLRLRLTKVLG